MGRGDLAMLEDFLSRIEQDNILKRPGVAQTLARETEIRASFRWVPFPPNAAICHSSVVPSRVDFSLENIRSLW